MTATASAPAGVVSLRSVRAYTVPTDLPEADGTIAWNSTTMVVVEAAARGQVGLGYTYGSSACVEFIRTVLSGCLEDANPMDIGATWSRMVRAARNAGRPGVGAMAISAVDNALWDLKAKILDVPLVDLLGRVRARIAVYGSGGFTSYDESQLCEQLSGWAGDGLPAVKMKVGTHSGDDPRRVHAARRAIGDTVELFVDANGAYGRKQALDFAERFAADRVRWFEEPVSSDDLDGLRLIRDRAPAVMDIAAGEYGFDPWYYAPMISAGAVDVLQADATRCLGITGFLRVAALADAFQIPVSSHCAPALHVSLMCAVPRAAELEWFYDHVRIEQMLFDGVPQPINGELSPDEGRPGLGLVLRTREAERFAS